MLNGTHVRNSPLATLMEKMKYLLGCGYYHPAPAADTFLALWAATLERYADPFPDKTVILSVGSSWRINHADAVPFADVVPLPGNLGHVHQLIGKQSPAKPHAFCGWSMGFLTLAMIAYNAELDFVYLEQDCLAIGPWVERIFQDMGDGDMAFGGLMKRPPYMPCAQALVVVRHRFIPEMVAAYLSLGTDANERNLPEHKFAAFRGKFGTKRIRDLSFGCDRERPIPMDDEVFYVQKLTPHEVAELRRNGRIA